MMMPGMVLAAPQLAQSLREGVAAPPFFFLFFFVFKMPAVLSYFYGCRRHLLLPSSSSS